ncbi:toprim domain-containing protein [Algoriphagus halophytocola]|uniref:Toprim domain-containing protein n=1 Tax=Algoriphagus halophytocola TaxID=2991499 RepID=A0ABY6MC26_9BACT|nr:toprim domain-containing protein [Algoriphagus sp. TR-M5]UZD21197.1 toprim domain-containing protein [Algoriphagus sp. TR-M5]
MNYTDLKHEASRIKRDFSIIDYFQGLVSAGALKYEGMQGKEHFFGFLSQRTGSIAVDHRTNVWYDHSAGRGGDVLEAVQVFENKTFSQSVEQLSDFPTERIVVPKNKPKAAPNIKIESVKKVSHPALLNYIRSRGLESDDISDFTKEVHWCNKGKSYFAVGFPNESGGWVLRSSIFKGNILGGGISIQILGTPERIKIFEGWFDFLSYLKLSEATDFKAIILNSTANLKLSLILNVLAECEVVDLYLDNDATGEKYTNFFMKSAQLYHYCRSNAISTDWDLNKLKVTRGKFEKLISTLKISSRDVEGIWCFQTEVTDQRYRYKGFEDLNELLKSHVDTGNQNHIRQ